MKLSSAMFFKMPRKSLNWWLISSAQRGGGSMEDFVGTLSNNEEIVVPPRPPRHANLPHQKIPVDPSGRICHEEPFQFNISRNFGRPPIPRLHAFRRPAESSSRPAGKFDKHTEIAALLARPKRWPGLSR